MVIHDDNHGSDQLYSYFLCFGSSYCRLMNRAGWQLLGTNQKHTCSFVRSADFFSYVQSFPTISSSNCLSVVIILNAQYLLGYILQGSVIRSYILHTCVQTGALTPSQYKVYSKMTDWPLLKTRDQRGLTASCTPHKGTRAGGFEWLLPG